MFRRLFNASVWGPNGVSAQDWRFRGLFRFVLPIMDALFIWFGVAGWWNGLATIDAATTQTWQEYWSLGIAVSAFLALVGVAFPRLWLVEVAGKASLIGLIAIYLFLFLQRSTVEPLLVATAGLYLSFVLLPIWRLSDLGYVWWKRRLAREAQDDTLRNQA